MPRIPISSPGARSKRCTLLACKFEPHSYDHPDMRNRGFDFVVFQILAPKEAIEARTGETCRFFAYPSGRYDQYVIDVLRSADTGGRYSPSRVRPTRATTCSL